MRDRRIGVGIDFGTSNSAAATFDGERVQLVQLERDGELGGIMPSATYVSRALQTETGQAAINQYITDNTSRTVELIPEVIGEYSQLNDSGGGGDEPAAVEGSTRKIYGQPMIDSGLQGRLFRGTKRLLGDEKVRRLMVFEQPFRLVALITPLLVRMRRAIQADVSHASYAHLGHPVNFEGRDTYRNRLALTRLGEAYKYAGITEQHFYPEPTAAAVSYLNANPDSPAETLLTLDFGGGTLDFCVLKRRGDDFDVVTTHGIAIGGDHIDQRLFRELLFPLLGKGERWRRKGFDREIDTAFPFEDYEDLLVNWAVTYTLNQNKYTTPVMDCIEQGGPALHKFRRLRELIKHNYSYLVFQELKEMKAALSSSDTARLDIPEIDIDIELSRGDFETMIEDLLGQVANAVDVTLERAEMAPDEIDLVLRTGGSSLIPAVRRLLEDRFDDRVVEHDPFTSVAVGLAIASYRQL